MEKVVKVSLTREQRLLERICRSFKMASEIL